MNIDLLIKTLALMLGLYVLAKLVSPFISDLLNPNRKKNDHDLDEMIRRKTDLLRVTGAATIQGSTQKKSEAVEKKESVDFIEVVKQSFRTLSLEANKNEQTKQKIGDLKRIMALLDSLQWGQSDELPNLRRRFEKHFDFAPDEALLIRALRLALIHAPLVDEKKQPISYDDFADYLVAICMHDIIRSAFTSSMSIEVQTMAKRWHTDLPTLQRSWLFWLFDKLKVGTSDFLKELTAHEGSYSASDLMTLCAFGPDGLPWRDLISEANRPRRGQELVDGMREELATMQAINQLPSAETITKKQSLDLLGFEAIPAPGVLSRRYKKLARLMHPDRLSSRGFPDNVMARANDNFRTLKAAYDLLKVEAENG